MRSTVLAIAFALVTAPAAAEMFKWKDADGNTQYGQTPPPGVQAQTIRAKPAPKSTPAAQSPQERLKALEAEKKLQSEGAATAEAEKKHAETRKRNCEIARKNLAGLQRGGHNKMRLPDGSYIYPTAEQKQERIDEANSMIEENCD